MQGKKGTGWTYGKDGNTFCRVCDRRVGTKPSKDCLEPKHHILYDRGKPNQRNRAYRWQLAQYGLSLSDYERLYSEQHGRCKLCGKQAVLSGKKGEILWVDHNHKTEKVRGLVCAGCNFVLGALDKVLEAGLLQRALAYLGKI